MAQRRILSYSLGLHTWEFPVGLPTSETVCLNLKPYAMYKLDNTMVTVQIILIYLKQPILQKKLP